MLSSDVATTLGGRYITKHIMPYSFSEFLNANEISYDTDTIATTSGRDIVEFYNKRGGKERIFDDMNNGFGWNRLPKSFMSENTVFLLLTALIHNFYKTIISKLDSKAFGLKETSRIKAFVFSFISVPAKWIMTARQYVLNIYTENRAYVRPFKTGFG